jgi:hypothetical protein
MGKDRALRGEADISLFGVVLEAVSSTRKFASVTEVPT